MDKAVTLLCAFSMGMCFSLLGAVSVKLMPRLRIDQGQFGTLVSAVMAACLVTSLVAGVVLDAVGYRPVALFGFVVSGVCVLLLAHVRTYPAVLGSCFLLGVGAMSLSMAAMTLMPVVLFGGKNPAAANNLGNVAFGVGLLLTPLLVSFLFRRISYELAVSVVAAIVVAPVIPALLAAYPQSQAAAFSLGDAVALLREPAVLVAGCALFCYTSLEQSFTSWLPAFGKEVIGARSSDASETDAAAQRLLSLFAVAMMLGRLGASQVPAITEYGSWMMAGAAVLAALVVLLMIVAWQPWQAAVLAVLAGLVLAPCFPTTVGITFAKYRPAIYGSVFGIIFAMAMLGGAIVPKLIGNLARGSSVQRSLRLLLPTCVVFAALVIVLGQIHTTP